MNDRHLHRPAIRFKSHTLSRTPAVLRRFLPILERLDDRHAANNLFAILPLVPVSGGLLFSTEGINEWFAPRTTTTSPSSGQMAIVPLMDRQISLSPLYTRQEEAKSNAAPASRDAMQSQGTPSLRSSDLSPFENAQAIAYYDGNEPIRLHWATNSDSSHSVSPAQSAQVASRPSNDSVPQSQPGSPPPPANVVTDYQPPAGLANPTSVASSSGTSYAAQTDEVRAITAGEDDSEVPENEPPIGVDDTATVGEDQTVDIAVLSNDTDPNLSDTISLLSWDVTTGGATVTQAVNGVLRYQPDPDFNGADTFTYTIVDDWGAEASATVSVTVVSANDSALAFNDAFSTRWVGDYHVSSGGLLGNDIDFDRGDPVFGQIRVLDYDGSGIIGSLSVNVPNGTFSWEGPIGWWGTTSFTYRITDDYGSISQATVTIIAMDMSIVPLAPTVADDAYQIGEDPVSYDPAEGVLANDSNGTLAVVLEQPFSGRLTAFAHDGSFTYEPAIGAGDQTFRYAVYNTVSGFRDVATVSLNELRMWIYNGGGGVIVPEKIRTEVGAFTVVNKNDTDGDGTPDNQDNSVKFINQATTPGVDEVDLMKLVIRPPVDPNPAGNKIKITVQGSAKLWESSTKETPVVLNNGVVELELGPTDITEFYVEVTEPNNSLRSITITMEYREAKYTVKATGIWVQQTQFFNTGSGDGALPQDAGGAVRNAYARNGKVLGATHPGLKLPRGGINMMYLKNVMVMEFTVSPAGIHKEPGVLFDSSRNKTQKTWNTVNGTRTLLPGSILDFAAYKDRPDDDAVATDEDNVPDVNNHLYSLDSPGTMVSLNINVTSIERRLNMFEFVSVLIQKTRLDKFSENRNGRLEGSRASEFIPWRSRSDFTRFGPEDWRRTVGGMNEIVQAPHVPLGN